MIICVNVSYISISKSAFYAFLHYPSKIVRFFVATVLKEITSTLWPTFSRELADVVTLVACVEFEVLRTFWKKIENLPAESVLDVGIDSRFCRSPTVLVICFWNLPP